MCSVFLSNCNYSGALLEGSSLLGRSNDVLFSAPLTRLFEGTGNLKILGIMINTDDETSKNLS